MQLSIIVPCYNEFSRLNLSSFRKLIHDYPNSKICFVNDGSNDETGILLNEFAIGLPDNVNVVHLSGNKGKAEAVRQGMLFMLDRYKSDYMCYLDADLSTPLQEAVRLADVMTKQQGLLLGFGSRVSVFGSRIKRLNYRHYGGRLIATMIDIVLNLSIYDTQCGLKVFSEALAKRIFDAPFLTRWLFDVEIFARMKLLYSIDELNYTMKEVPLTEWNEKGNSKLKFKDVLAVPFALYNIMSRYKDDPPIKGSMSVTNMAPVLSHQNEN
jgi:dolichyl-phosphate beta-glucosyltransferase